MKAGIRDGRIARDVTVQEAAAKPASGSRCLRLLRQFGRLAGPRCRVVDLERADDETFDPETGPVCFLASAGGGNSVMSTLRFTLALSSASNGATAQPWRSQPICDEFVRNNNFTANGQQQITSATVNQR